MCEYANGATGVFVTTTGDAHGTNRLEIQLDRARIVVEGGKISLLEYEMTEQDFSKTNTAPFATVAANKVEVETDGENPQHVGVINAWGGAILRGEPLVADGSEGINGLDAVQRDASCRPGSGTPSHCRLTRICSIRN